MKNAHSTPATLTSGLVPRSDETRAWPIAVNGRPLADAIGEPVRTLVIDAVRNPSDPDGTRLGSVEYGAEPDKDGRPGRYDTWIFREMGGAVTLPFAIIDGELHVGLVTQRRYAEIHPTYNPTGKVPNAPRGFHDPNKIEGEATAQAELQQEVGPFEGQIFRLPGENVTCNNAWMQYVDEEKDGQSCAQGGVNFHAIEVGPNSLERRDDGTYAFPAEVTAGRPQGSAYEVIGRCEFVHWTKATEARDGFTAIAVVRLMAHLVTEDRGTFYL